MRKYKVKPEFEKFKKFRMPKNLFLIKLFNIFLKLSNLFIRTPKNILYEKKYIYTRDQKKIAISVYSPITQNDILPVLLYYPGGGFMMSPNIMHKKGAILIAIEAQCRVIIVHYRLAPKYIFPIPLFDSFDALTWVYNQAEMLKIDKDKIALAGDSSGGSLVAGVVLMSRDQNGPKICSQILIYPALDKLSATGSSRRKFKNAPVFNTRNFAFINKIVYKKGYFGLKNYAYPLTEQSYIDLPPTYIETAEFDCLHDDGVRYASVLKKAGVPVVLFETKGTFHGYDAAPDSPLIQVCMKKRIETLKSAFGTN